MFCLFLLIAPLVVEGRYFELNKTVYEVGENIIASWKDSPGGTYDWICISARSQFKADCQDPQIIIPCWVLTDAQITGSRTLNATSKSSGEQPALWPLSPGEYEAQYFLNYGYCKWKKARPFRFTIIPSTKTKVENPIQKIEDKNKFGHGHWIYKTVLKRGRKIQINFGNARKSRDLEVKQGFILYKGVPAIEDTRKRKSSPVKETLDKEQVEVKYIYVAESSNKAFKAAICKPGPMDRLHYKQSLFNLQTETIPASAQHFESKPIEGMLHQVVGEWVVIYK